MIYITNNLVREEEINGVKLSYEEEYRKRGIRLVWHFLEKSFTLLILR